MIQPLQARGKESSDQKERAIKVLESMNIRTAPSVVKVYEAPDLSSENPDDDD